VTSDEPRKNAEERTEFNHGWTQINTDFLREWRELTLILSADGAEIGRATLSERAAKILKL